LVADLVIKNSKLVIPGTGIVEAGLAVEQGRICTIAKETSLPKGDRTIDAKGNFVLPGAIDPHTHIGAFKPFGEEYVKETQAAANGGITTVGVYFRTDKSYDDVFAESKKYANSVAMTDTFFHFGLVNDLHLDEMPKYFSKFGVASFKLYFAGVPEIGILANNDGYCFEAMRRVAALGPPAIINVHAENGEIVDYVKAHISHEKKDLAAWSETSPNFTEGEIVSRATTYAKVQNAPIYIVHLNTKEGVAAVSDAKAKHPKTVAETCPHYLTVSKDDDTDYKVGKLGKTLPPLREKESLEKLWWGLASGVVDTVGTDHLAMRKEQRMLDKDIWECFVAWQGLETMLPVLLFEGVNKKRLSIERVAEVSSTNTAKAFGLYPKKGAIAVGSDADLVIVDMNKKVKVGPEILRGTADFTLYDGATFTGWPTMTILRGNVTMEDGKIVGKAGTGQYIPRGPAS
jgi:dihydroorotase (multifunctional complex type)